MRSCLLANHGYARRNCELTPRRMRAPPLIRPPVSHLLAITAFVPSRSNPAGPSLIPTRTYTQDSNADLVASVPRRRPHSFSTRPAGVRQTVTCSNVHDYYKEKSSELLPPGSLSTPASMKGSGKRHGNGQRGRTLLRAHSSGRITRALAARRLVGDVGWEDEGGEKRV